jgi:hypothetical protein
MAMVEQRPYIPMVILGAGALCFTIRFLCKRTDGGIGRRLRRIPWGYALFIVVYCAFLLVSIAYFDRLTPLSERIMAPAYMAWLVGLLVMWALACMRGVNPWPVRFIATVPWLVLVVLQVPGGIAFAQREYTRTRSVPNRWSPQDVALCESLPWDRVVYSNHPEDLYIFGDKIAKLWPCANDTWSGLPAPGYQEDFETALAELRTKDGRLVMFGGLSHLWRDPASLQRELSLVPVRSSPRMRVYRPQQRPARRLWRRP